MFKKILQFHHSIKVVSWKSIQIKTLTKSTFNISSLYKNLSKDYTLIPYTYIKKHTKCISCDYCPLRYVVRSHSFFFPPYDRVFSIRIFLPRKTGSIPANEKEATKSDGRKSPGWVGGVKFSFTSEKRKISRSANVFLNKSKIMISRRRRSVCEWKMATACTLNFPHLDLSV